MAVSMWRARTQLLAIGLLGLPMLNWPAGAAYGFTLVLLCLAFITLVMALFKVRLTDIAK